MVLESGDKNYPWFMAGRCTGEYGWRNNIKDRVLHGSVINSSRYLPFGNDSIILLRGKRGSER